MQTEPKTWATLKPDTPFNQLFPDGIVPIVSILPIIPRELGAPKCYLVPGNKLTDEQIRGLAEMLWHQWQPECQSLEDAIAYIQNDSLPLNTDWFLGCGTTNQGMMMSLVELGEELRQEHEDDPESWDDWDDWDEEGE